MPADDLEEDRALYYRTVAARLRQIARQQRFDYRRAGQLQALADGFDRLAERLERSDAKSD